MPQWLSYLLVFIFGLLFRYIFEVLNLFIDSLANNSTLHASKIQKEINNLSDVEAPELESCIGFRYEPQNEEEDYDEEIEEDKIKNN